MEHSSKIIVPEFTHIRSQISGIRSVASIQSNSGYSVHVIIRISPGLSPVTVKKLPGRMYLKSPIVPKSMSGHSVEKAAV